MQEPCHLCFIIKETILHETMKVLIAEPYIMTLEQTQVTQHDLGMCNVNYTCMHVVILCEGSPHDVETSV